MLIVGALSFIPDDAEAMPHALSSEVATCGYAPMIGVNGFYCQGSYIGGGLIVTAAHCVDALSENPATILFGDKISSNKEKYRFEDVECEVHATWDAQNKQGVDLAVCYIDEQTMGAPPSVPLAYPTPPDGCEVAYLRHKLDQSTCEVQSNSDCYDGIPGVHVSTGPDENELHGGPKRWTDSVVVWQEEWGGSPLMFRTAQPGTTDPNLVTGDSGAPLYINMPDGSWRLVAVHSGHTDQMYSQTVPPYYAWIEDVHDGVPSSYDILPCHKWDYLNSEFVYDDGAPNCENRLNIAFDAPNTTWTYDCTSIGDLGAGADGCGGWPTGVLQLPDPKWSQPYVDPAPHDAIVAQVQAEVDRGIIACDLSVIEDEIVQRGEYYAAWPYLAERPPAGWIGLHSEASLDARNIYGTCS